MRRPHQAVRTVEIRQYRCQRFLLTERQQESNYRFGQGFRRDHVPITSTARINTRGLSSAYLSYLLVDGTHGRDQRPLAALKLRFHTEFVDLSRGFEL